MVPIKETYFVLFSQLYIIRNCLKLHEHLSLLVLDVVVLVYLPQPQEQQQQQQSTKHQNTLFYFLLVWSCIFKLHNICNFVLLHNSQLKRSDCHKQLLPHSASLFFLFLFSNFHYSVYLQFIILYKWNFPQPRLQGFSKILPNLQ